jgi:AraC family transcriptional activator of mtrCDE
MDVLSRLVELSHLQPALDVRCQLAGQYRIDNEQAPAGAIPFHLVLAGGCIISIDAGQQVALRAGDFLLLRHGGPHAIINAADGPTYPIVLSHEGIMPLLRSAQASDDVDLLCGHFECSVGASAFLLDALPDPFHASLLNVHSEETLKMMGSVLRHETTEERPGALTIVTALCLALLVMALRARDASPSTIPGLLVLLTDQRLSKSVKAMIAAPADRWTIDQLASLSAMSRAAYARRFKDRAAMTVGEFLTDFRMAVASDSLLRTRRAIADIAAAVGYESEAAFGKAFKANSGLSPAQFRLQGASQNRLLQES